MQKDAECSRYLFLKCDTNTIFKLEGSHWLRIGPRWLDIGGVGTYVCTPPLPWAEVWILTGHKRSLRGCRKIKTDMCDDKLCSKKHKNAGMGSHRQLQAI